MINKIKDKKIIINVKIKKKHYYIYNTIIILIEL